MALTEQRTQFDYLLNSMELAGLAHNPHMEGYGDKRKALFAYVRDLEARVSAPPPGGRQGWQWVPVEPTPEMISAAVASWGGNNPGSLSAYHAMLAAAPSLPEGPAAAPQDAAWVEHRCWLIETVGAPTPLYFSGVDEGFVQDVDAAIRFPSDESAKGVLLALRGENPRGSATDKALAVLRMGLSCYRVVEHIFDYTPRHLSSAITEGKANG